MSKQPVMPVLRVLTVTYYKQPVVPVLRVLTVTYYKQPVMPVLTVLTVTYYTVVYLISALGPLSPTQQRLMFPEVDLWGENQ